MPERLVGGLPAAPSSFRDPAGSLWVLGDRVLRISNSGSRDLLAFLASGIAGKLAERGDLVLATTLDRDEALAILREHGIAGTAGCTEETVFLEHQRIWFPSYPYEWPPEMLHAAARLTLNLARDCLGSAFGLKDATPYNILFEGSRPVFVDWSSFETRDPGDPIWLASAQFQRTFLLPLLACKQLGLPLELLLQSRRDGLEPEEVHRWSAWWQKIRPSFLMLVTLPAWLGARQDAKAGSIYQRKTLPDPERAQFVLRMHLRHLERLLRRLQPPAARGSAWSGYMTSCESYSPAQFEAKEAFIAELLRRYRPSRVLDIGCNTGHFSLLAAAAGCKVVAIDADPVVVGKLWTAAVARNLDVLPLVVNFYRPTPALGWRNRECASFLDRARGRFDAVLMLAVLHHLLVTERVPLPQILELAAELTRDLLLIEFVGPDDPMFLRIVRGRQELHRDLTPDLFEEACRRQFEIVAVRQFEGSSRRLYVLKRRR